MKLKNTGFTLIELLVVVLIIGILSAIALPQYQKSVMKAQLATIKPFTSSAYLAVQEYILANDASVSSAISYVTFEIGSEGWTDWGHCIASQHPGLSGGSCLSCFHEKSGMGYYICPPQEKNDYVEKRFCSADSSAGHKVCQQETSKSATDVVNSSYYEYP